MRNIFRTVAAVVALVAAVDAVDSEACTRVIYTGADDLIVVGRSLDWKTPIPTNVYVYPRGIAKTGASNANTLRWISRYGAVYAVSYDAGVTEGMNEKGLSVNGLFCKGTIYATAQDTVKPTIALAMFPAWILDMCATTAEVRTMLNATPFYLYGAKFDGDTSSTLHWGITDPSGDTMIIEFTDGVMHLYDVNIKDYPCMTNDPTWPQMTAIVDYWEKKGGQNTLPGTVSSPDRCVRGNYFAKHVERTADVDRGVAIARTTLMNCCVPYAYTTSTDGEPNVSMTQWRSLSDLRDLRYYFDPVYASGLWYVDLNKCDLRPGASVMKITTADMLNAVGDQTRALKKSAPFIPM